MKNSFQHSFLRLAIVAATIGTPSAAYADTIIDKDTLIDGNSPVNENYSIVNGATLTSNGSIARSIQVSDGHLAMTGGGIERVLHVGYDGTANIEDAFINTAFLQGDAQFNNVVIESQLILGAAKLSAKNIKAENFVNYGGESVVENGFFDDTQGATAYNGAVEMSGANGVFIGSTINGLNAGVVFDGPNELKLIRSNVWSVNGPAFKANVGSQDISLQNGSTAGSEKGELLIAKKNSNVSLSLDTSQAAGTIRAEDNAVVDVALSNGSHLSGAMTNVNSLSLDGTSLYEMTTSSDIKALSMAGGTVKFAPAEGGEYRTLTLGTLSGNGNFMMNADLLSGEGDLLDISGTASGKYTLHLAATGARSGEPRGAGAGTYRRR